MSTTGQYILVATVTPEGRSKGVPQRPPGFRPMKSSYTSVSSRAVKLNQKQLERGFQDYVFSPEPVDERKNSS